MKDNKGNFIYFSSIGNYSYDNRIINKYYKEKKPKKNLIRNKLIDETNSSFFENEESKDIFEDKDIFNISYQKNKTESVQNDNSSIPFFLIDKNNNNMNKYKYYLNHLQKLKKLKKEKEINTNNKKYYEQDYEPNIDFIKKRVIIGPKWELLSGRKDSLKKLKDNAVLIKKSISKDKNVVIILMKEKKVK